ncbi:MAG TPA: monofunctional biosynthetic peptidoglycan transglycosylase [Myxococcota bacterium]|nr:monofunctional biosynthetic peptidoglycan transglycosylase [Myxococcota bacterium]
MPGPPRRPALQRLWRGVRRARLPLGLVLLLGALLAWCGLSQPDVGRLRDHNPETTALIELRREQGKLPKGFPPLTRAWVPLGRIPRLLQRAVVLAEDAAFWQHDGVDWHEVEAAARTNLREGRVVRGASTISQQLVKNLYLSPRRSYLRKLEEWYLVDRLEEELPKARILELYLNCIEWGPGIYGVGPASRAYFGKAPAALGLDEMARLAAVIPRPLRLSPVRRSAELVRRSEVVLARLEAAGFASAEEHQAALAAIQACCGPPSAPPPEQAERPLPDSGPPPTPEPAAPD